MKTKKYISLEDILGIRVQCKNCDLIVEGSIESLAESMNQRNLLGACPSRKDHSWSGGEPAIYLNGADTFVKEFIRNLKSFKDNAPKIGCSLAFEIDQDKDTAA